MNEAMVHMYIALIAIVTIYRYSVISSQVLYNAHMQVKRELDMHHLTRLSVC